MQMHIRIDGNGDVTKWTKDDTPPPGYEEVVKSTLEARELDYGDFARGSEVFHALLWAMKEGDKWCEMDPYQQSALTMIAHKISRLLNGNPNHRDGWHDIAGYATLAERELARRVQEA